MRPHSHILSLARNGCRYAHPLEEEMAEILEKEDIPYEYGVFFKVRNGDGVRQVDFVLKIEARTKLCNRLVKYIELKNGDKDSKNARQQHNDLEASGIDTIIFNKDDVKFFRENGFLKKVGLTKARKFHKAAL